MNSTIAGAILDSAANYSAELNVKAERVKMFYDKNQPKINFNFMDGAGNSLVKKELESQKKEGKRFIKFYSAYLRTLLKDCKDILAVSTTIFMNEKKVECTVYYLNSDSENCKSDFIL